MVCNTCNEDKSVESFPFRSKKNGTRNGKCKQCKREYNKDWYAENAEKHKKNVRRYSKRKRNELRNFIRAQKEGQPCTDCGQVFPFFVMDYDHIEGDKIDDVSRLIVRHSREIIQREIEKCELVCANCHRVRSYEREIAPE